MITLKDIAKLANVDPSTVSRALNNTSYVHPETKNRIKKAMEQLSYEPDLVKKAIQLGKRKTIGVVVPDLRLSIFGGLVEIIETEATKKNYEILIGLTKDNPGSEKETLNRLRNGFLDGLIIASTGNNKRLIRDIQVSGIPIVQLIRAHDKYINSVIGNYYECAYTAVAFLVSKGCKNIGFINGTLKQFPYAERYRGYIDAMVENNLASNVILSNKMDKDHYSDAYLNVDFFLKENPQIDAILVATDIQGMAVLRRLKEKNILIPDQIKIVSLTGNSIGNLLETSLTSMELPGEKIGKKATEMIIEAIEEKSYTPENLHKITFDSFLIEREST